MLLSKPELFWLGLVVGSLRTDHFPLPEDERFGDWDHSPSTGYGRLIQMAGLCGLGRFVAPEPCNRLAPTLDPATVSWWVPSMKGDPVDWADVSVAISALQDAAAQARQRLDDLDPTGKASAAFDTLLKEGTPAFRGRIAEAPGTEYGIRLDARVYVLERVKPLPVGTLRTVLGFLQEHIELPAFVRHAISSQPSARQQPAAKLDALALADFIETELVGQTHHDTSYTLGQALGASIATLKNVEPWLSYQLASSITARLVDVTLDGYVPFKPGDFEQEDFDPTADTEPEWDAPEEPEDDLPTPADSDDVTARVWKAFKAVREQTQIPLRVPELPLGLTTQLRALKETLEATMAQSGKLAIDSTRHPLEVGIRLTTELLADFTQADADTRLGVTDEARHRREQLMEFGNDLDRLVALIFGELRTRDLHDSPGGGGLTAEAFDGWSSLVINARDSIREGMGMLAKGLPPYVVISTLEPTLETIVRKLAATHVPEQWPDNRYFNVGGALHDLMAHARASGNDRLASVTSVAMALRPRRNQAQHDARSIYDRHDAQFFLSGLVVMLRTLPAIAATGHSAREDDGMADP